MACTPKLYTETAISKRIVPDGWNPDDMTEFVFTLTLENAPGTTVDFTLTGGKVTYASGEVLANISATDITTAGKYLVKMRMTDSGGIRGITPCPDFLEFFD